jgi:transcriptional regulator with XRE-family HTH domain
MTDERRGKPTIPKEVWDRVRPKLKDRVGRGKPMQVQKLADSLGLTAPAVSQWLSGKNRPDLSNLVQALRAVGLDPSAEIPDLLHGEATAAPVRVLINARNALLSRNPDCAPDVHAVVSEGLENALTRTESELLLTFQDALAARRASASDNSKARSGDTRDPRPAPLPKTVVQGIEKSAREDLNSSRPVRGRKARAHRDK